MDWSKPFVWFIHCPCHVTMASQWHYTVTVVTITWVKIVGLRGGPHVQTAPKLNSAHPQVVSNTIAEFEVNLMTVLALCKGQSERQTYRDSSFYRGLNGSDRIQRPIGVIQSLLRICRQANLLVEKHICCYKQEKCSVLFKCPTKSWHCYSEPARTWRTGDLLTSQVRN